VTRPFGFEGSRRARAAEEGILELQQYVDTLIVIPNQNLFRMANERTTWKEAFKMADQVLYMGVRGVTDLMMVHGQINLDFADIKTVMAEMGKAMMGTGEAEGDDRAKRAAEAAINNPLLEETSMAGARGLLINITGGEDLTLFEVEEAVSTVRKQVDDEANVLFGSATDETLAGRIRVSVVATGIDGPAQGELPRPKLVAVGGGVPLPEPLPIPIPSSGPAQMAGSQARTAAEPEMHAPGSTRQATNVSALRQPAAQPERVIIPDPLASSEEPLSDSRDPVQQPRPLSTAVPRPKQPSGLFAHQSGTVQAAPPQPTGDTAARGLFQTATGLFRRRAAPAPAPRIPGGDTQIAQRREPVAAGVSQMAHAGELAMDPERPSERRPPTMDDSGLDIPAFLRRQSS
jgi:cell division protein FtsZ